MNTSTMVTPIATTKLTVSGTMMPAVDIGVIGCPSDGTGVACGVVGVEETATTEGYTHSESGKGRLLTYYVCTFHCSMSSSSTLEPGNIGRPQAISKKMQPQPLFHERMGGREGGREGERRREGGKEGKRE